MDNSTMYSNSMANVPTWEGISALLITVCGIGSYHVPIRKFSAGDGFFVQFCMSIGILTFGFLMYGFSTFPEFEPVAILGGIFWAIANAISQRVINGLGLAVGMLMWNATSCLTGWLIGRYGLFGLEPKPPHSDILNICGICLMLLGSFIISFVKKYPRTDQKEATAKKLSIYFNDIIIPGVKSLEHKSFSMPDMTIIEIEARNEHACFSRHTERKFCIGLALFAGLFYGLTPTPILYIEENHSKFLNAPHSLALMFPMFFGIFLSSTILFICYTIWKKNKPEINPEIAIPSIFGGMLWGLSISALIVSIRIFGQPITYPITTSVPGIIASLWSIFYFKEINNRRNYMLLGSAFLIIGTGAFVVFLSKIQF